jgi:tRNA 2-thiocytidine biosynthesis protein TtcA
MARPGETWVVAVSGRDSLVLTYLAYRAWPEVSLHPVHVDLGFGGGRSAAEEPLRACLAGWGLPLHVLRVDVAREVGGGGKRPCFLCARRRRRALLEEAERLGATTLALGHTQDDLVETLFLNILFNREVSTAHPRQPLFGGRFHVVRPLCRVEARAVSALAHALAIPPIPQPCPHAGHTERERVRRFLREVRRDHPDVIRNAYQAMGRVRADFLPTPLPPSHAVPEP